MRKLIFGINMTIDGCCDHTKTMADEEVHDYFTGLIQDAGLLLYGRKTYELMVPFWPDAAKKQDMGKTLNEFAKAFSAVDRVVVSRTLESAGGDAIIRDNLADEILKLKQQPGKNIMTGGVDLPSQLIALGLVDEFYFLIQPLIAGEGRRMMEATAFDNTLKVELVDSKSMRNGCVALHYVKL